MNNTIVVIGGGASGMMAAISAARSGANVTILEQNNKLGKKILSTGNGHCNMTNLIQRSDYYRSSTSDFIPTVLRQFLVEDTLSFFKELGILPKNKNNYIYPRSNQATSVVEVLEMELRRLKVKCKTKETVVEIQKLDQGFSVITKTWHYECDKVILACGSKASVIEGADGSGYKLARQMGHNIIEPLPALVGLKGVGNWFSKWAGVRTDGTISLYIEEHPVISDTGEIQLTDYGISGIPIFQISRYAVRALSEGKKVSVCIDFLPDTGEKELFSLLNEVFEFNPSKNQKQLLLGLLPSKLIDVISMNCSDISQLVKQIKAFPLDIKESLDFSHAQVCSGGVSCEEIYSETMESKLLSGLYFCGELTDVDGACGGYNLQWAWSSGYLAGFSAAKETI